MDLISIFQTKTYMLNKNPEDLKVIINKLQPNMNITNNLDRTISIQNYEKSCNLSDTLNEAITEWVGTDFEKSVPMSYSIFKFNNNAYLVKI